ncbi:Panacea domain-containing protein [Candidatus Phytoplasma pruni]|uniref:DUF4065 domain-containing protein n=1 Tax=Candidatus Phytoplasma pruni TaxID=479893 RepID=A0A851H9H2_9MOLU|nr:type II toxin-antitoxin system antitoxin SocA domain-containing protein [Candidatus Phytoplasma pruni]NWN45582.1 DUF4065 domain-containing protein [Candidatus Phytoplasma pruni]
METQNNHPLHVLDIAQYLIKHQNKNDYTNMKLQKLVFLAYSKYCIDNEKNSLFFNDFQAWAHGPVSLELYRHTMKYDQPFPKDFQLTDQNPDLLLDEKQKETLQYILKKYGRKTTAKLVEITHQNGSPWDLSYFSVDWDLNRISNETIVLSYANLKKPL